MSRYNCPDYLAGLRCRPALAQKTRSAPPLVLLVEPRDEVFARLAADLAEAGLVIARAATPRQTLKRSALDSPVLVIVGLHDPIGWQLVSKLRFLEPATPIWTYATRRSPADITVANGLGVEALLHYGGDLWQLSVLLLDCLAGRSADPLAHDYRVPSATRIAVSV